MFPAQLSVTGTSTLMDTVTIKGAAANAYKNLVFEDSTAGTPNRYTFTPTTAALTLSSPAAKNLIYTSASGLLTAEAVSLVASRARAHGNAFLHVLDYPLKMCVRYAPSAK